MLRSIVLSLLLGVTFVSAVRRNLEKIKTFDNGVSITSVLYCTTEPAAEPMDEAEAASHEPPDSIIPGDSLLEQTCNGGELRLFWNATIGDRLFNDTYEFKMFIATECMDEINTDAATEISGVEINGAADYPQFTFSENVYIPTVTQCEPVCLMIAVNFNAPERSQYLTTLKTGMLLDGREQCMFPYNSSIESAENYRDTPQPAIVPAMDDDGYYYLSWVQIANNASTSNLNLKFDLRDNQTEILNSFHRELNVVYFIRPTVMPHDSPNWLWRHHHCADGMTDVGVGDLVLGTSQVPTEEGAAIPPPDGRVYLTGPKAECYVRRKLCGGPVQLTTVLDYTHQTDDPDRCGNTAHIDISIICPDDMEREVPSVKLFYNHVTQGSETMALHCHDDMGYSFHTYNTEERTWKKHDLIESSPLEFFGYKRLEMMQRPFIEQADSSTCSGALDHDFDLESGLGSFSRSDYRACKEAIIEAFSVHHCECHTDFIQHCPEAVELLRNALTGSCMEYEPARVSIQHWMGEYVHIPDWTDLCEPAMHRSFMFENDFVGSRQKNADMLLRDLYANPDIHFCCSDSGDDCEERYEPKLDMAEHCGEAPWMDEFSQADKVICASRLLTREMKMNRAHFLKRDWDLKQLMRRRGLGYGLYDWMRFYHQGLLENFEKECGVMDPMEPSRHAPSYIKATTDSLAGQTKIQIVHHNIWADDPSEAYCWHSIAQTSCPECARRMREETERNRGSGYGSGYYGSGSGSGRYGWGSGYGSGYYGSGSGSGHYGWGSGYGSGYYGSGSGSGRYGWGSGYGSGYYGSGSGSGRYGWGSGYGSGYYGSGSGSGRYGSGSGYGSGYYGSGSGSGRHGSGSGHGSGRRD